MDSIVEGLESIDVAESRGFKICWHGIQCEFAQKMCNRKRNNIKSKSSKMAAFVPKLN